eukprot:TRINITY_DN95213_c0_g1_i1.p1 TRINITY_DN95213_c0_g1~~TRINITY_DN95213_c0_g1_i1.p1  ORF type:complete len:248 (-),score=48.61 TRINITY_DN95213_c0_g1_i1:95-838(-)
MMETQIRLGDSQHSFNDVSKAVKNAGYRIGCDKFTAEFLNPIKLNIKTLVDVGVQTGTPPLYKAFPKSKIVMVEAQPGLRDAIDQRFGGKYDYDYIECGAGEAPGELELTVTGAASTFLEKYSNSEADARFAGRVTVPVRRLDDILEGYEPPYGIKVDTEGFELAVLKGATGVLDKTEFVIAEVSVRPRFIGSYTFAEIVSFLDGHGLTFLSVLNDKEGVNTFYDCLFVRHDHPVFATKDRRSSADH